MANQQDTQHHNETNYAGYGNWIISIDPEILCSLIEYSKYVCTELFGSQGDLNGKWEIKFLSTGAWTAIPLASKGKTFVLTNPVLGLQHELSPLATGLLGASAFWTKVAKGVNQVVAIEASQVKNAKRIAFINEARERLYDAIDSDPDALKIWQMVGVL